MDNELKLYHGSPNEFTQFDTKFLSMSLYGWGFNFSTDLDLAMDFGDKIYTIEVPDDAKFLDFENNDMYDEILNKVVEDIESHGISRDYMNLDSISQNFNTFKERFWLLQSKYSSLLGLSRAEAMKRLSDIIKSFGYIGTKYKYIYVIFDRDSFKITNIRKVRESVNFDGIAKKVLNESLSQRAYHFTDLSNLHHMIDTDTIRFSKPSRRDMMLNIKYGRSLPYYLSTTRVRDCRFGFSPAFDVRIELNADKFNSNYISKPVSFFKGSNSESYKNYYTRSNGYAKEYERQFQPYVENEDRIFSNTSEVHNIAKYITRIDILLPINDIQTYFNEHKDIYNMLRDIYNHPMGLKTFVYNNKNQFNRQGKNITEPILQAL